ncbi:hypothetical protein PoB_006134200 [Plakobranchus ocellatus]|uniref:Uncharacterized protein n=1 Tax=Plakobranchus ocellatus TaxID=259542 RepID=A0AAV4CSG8_9GAST|nr:hypothetical protein PoB_006134200 [Plakobranchus ocellatus]
MSSGFGQSVDEMTLRCGLYRVRPWLGRSESLTNKPAIYNSTGGAVLSQPTLHLLRFEFKAGHLHPDLTGRNPDVI